ncbi:MAG: carboxypeptidase-like regulatory domain-containing protein, partial [Sinomicrobium sp.]|nr:carboxypeptidase-like regulatory domain-containing protein [Sinomicrobium sp.]
TTEKNFDIRFNLPVEIKGRGLALDIAENAGNRDTTFWKTYRPDSISQRGEATYKIIDSIVEEEDIERNIKLARKLLRGYYPTKYIDLDLRYLLKYNGYEGFRIGMGGVTNSGFSQKYRLNAYLVYGTKDHKFKYGLGAAARLDRFTDTWLGGFYTDDLVETGSYAFITEGRSFSLLEPRLFNIERFHKNRSAGAYLAHDITPKFQTKLQFTSNRIAPTYNYTFIKDGAEYSGFKTTTLTFAAQWDPFSDYMMTPQGKSEIRIGYPKFTLQLTQGIAGILDADFNFTKLNIRA